MSSIRANVITRRLRAHGVRTLPSGTSKFRRGIRVTEARSLHTVHTVHIDVDLPTTSESNRVAEQITVALREDGYVVTPNPHMASMLTVEAGVR